MTRIRRDMSQIHLRVTRTTECHALHLSTLIVMDDPNSRPHKRQRTDHTAECAETSPPRSPQTTRSQSLSTFRPLPPQVLLLALPALLAHPPSHEYYPLSLFLSLRALRTCLELKTLTPDVECRAWTGLAEVGLRVINSGFTASGEHAWANGLEAEVSYLPYIYLLCSYALLYKVEKAIGKGVRLIS